MVQMVYDNVCVSSILFVCNYRDWLDRYIMVDK